MSKISRRDFVKGMITILVVSSTFPISGCNGAPDLGSLVKETKEGILMDYEIIPNNPEVRRKSKFRTYAFARPGGRRLFSPLLSDERWSSHYKNLENLFQEPLDGLRLEDVDPIFGMFAYRVHPTTFFPRYHHTAIDIFKPKGKEIRASYEGKAEVSHNNLAGNWVKIIHPIKTKDGYHLETRYLHLDEVKVKTGNEVHKGEVIGTLGGTGIMDGYFPHLHYEVVMINNEGVGLPIILDPAQIYFDSPERGFFERIFADPQLDFRSITRDIRGEKVVYQLAQTINDANPNDRRFLQLYKEYWNYASNEKGSQKAKQLLERLR